MFGALALIGAALTAVGAGLYSLPAGLIVGGLWCVVVAVAGERERVASKSRQPERERL